MEKKELELVKKAGQGFVEEYGYLVNKYSNVVFAAALGKTGDHFLAEDIAQEVFVKAWFNLSDLKQPETFLAWLLTITRHMCTDWLRKKNKTKEQSIDPKDFDMISTQHDPFHQLEIRTSVWSAIRDLDEKYRIPAILFFVSGYRANEIGILLGISKPAVESRLRRAKEKLKEELYEMMKDVIGEKKLGKEFKEEVLWRIVPRIATIEIPVTDVASSVEWYSKILGTKAAFQDDQSAMLHLQGANRLGVPTLYLVQTEDLNRLSFKNTNTGVTHSVIDFYFHELEKFHTFLQTENVETTKINYFPDMPGYGGFGFYDPSGNLLSVTNITHSGQE